MDTQGTIGIKATLDISEMHRNVQKYVQNINMMQDHTDVASQSVARSFSRMQAAGAAFLSLDMAKRLGSEMISVYGTFQQLDISFRTMLQNGEKARVLMSELVDFAAITPFNLTDVGQGAKQLLAYGTAADKITTELEMLGNVASGVSVPLGDLIYLYGTLRSQGRAYAVDIRQFAGRGIPIYEELAKVLKVNVGEVNSLVEAGSVGFPEVEKAFQNMTAKGGMFFNLMKEQSKTVKGQISNLMDKIDTKFNELGQSNDAFITAGISGANYLVDHYEEVGSVLAGLIALYGVHKTALIAVAAVKNISAAAAFKAEAAALQELETAEIKASLSKRNLVAGTKEYIEALNVEMNAEKDRLTQTAATANAELSVAKDRLALAEQTKAKALENIRLQKEELASALSKVQAKKTASLEKKMSIESEKQSRAALSLVKLQEEKDAAIAEARHLKEIKASDEKIVAKNREIAAINKKIIAAKAEEIQHSRNVVTLRKEIAAVGENATSKHIETLQTRLNTAEEKLNSAEINVNTAASEVNQLQTKAGIATKEADTLTTKLNTIEEKKNTAAKSLSARATALLTTSWSKLTGVMKANQWTLILAAIAAVGYGIYKLITHQTEAEKWQGKLNDRFREFNSEVAVEKTEIDQLFGKLDAAKGKTEEYQAAKDAIIDKYGDYLRGLGDEIEKLKDVEAAYKAISAAAQQSAIDRAISDAKGTVSDTYKENSTKHLEQLEKAIRSKIKNERDASALYSTIVQDIQKNGVLSDVTAEIVRSFSKNIYNRGADGVERLSKIDNPILDAADALKKEREKFYSALSDIDHKFGKASVDYLSMTSKEIKSIIDRYEAEIKAGRGTIQISIDLPKAKKALEEVKKQESKIVEPDVTKEIGDTIKKIADLKKEIEDLRSGKTKVEVGTTVKKAIEDKQKELKDAETALGVLTGQDKQTVKFNQKKQEEANELKVEQAERKKKIEEYTKNISDQIVQSEFEIRQNHIDALKDGFDKQKAIIDLTYDKLIEENRKREENWLEEARSKAKEEWINKNPEYKKQGLIFEESEEYKKVSLSLDQQGILKKYIDNANEYQKTSTDKLLKDLLTKYQNFEQRRTEINKQFDAERKLIENGKTIDGKEISQETKEAALVELEKMRKDALKGLNDEEIASMQKSSDFLIKLFEDASNKSVSEINKIMSETEQLLAYLSQTKTEDISPKFGFSADELKALKAEPKQIEAIQKAINELYAAGVKKNPFSALIKGIKDLFKAGKEEGEGSLSTEAKLARIGESAAESANTVGGLAGNLAEMFEAAGNDSAAEAMSTVQNVMGAISNIGEGFAKGGIIGGIGAAIGEAVNFISQAFAANARHKAALREIMNETISQQREYNLLLMQQNLEYEKGTTIFGTDTYGKAANAVGVMKKAVADLNAELKGSGKYSGGYAFSFKKGIYDTFSKEQRRLVNAYAGLANIEIKTGHKKTGLFGWGKGKDIYSSILSIYPELIDQNGKFNASLAETIIATRTMSDEDKAAFQNMIDLSKQAEEALQTMTDYLTDIFGELGTTMSNALVDAFRNGTDAGEAFVKSVSSMLEKLSEEMIYSVTIAPYIEQAQKQMLDVMKNDDLTDEQKFRNYVSILDNLTDGVLSQQGNYYELLKKYKEMAAEKGIEIFKPDEEERKSVSKSGITASQDSINEVNGRLMATTIFLSDILKAVQTQTDATNNMSIAMYDMKAMSVQMNENLRIIKDNMIVVIGHLSNIDVNTSKLIDIQKDINSVRKTIEGINDKGLKML